MDIRKFVGTVGLLTIFLGVSQGTMSAALGSLFGGDDTVSESNKKDTSSVATPAVDSQLTGDTLTTEKTAKPASPSVGQSPTEQKQSSSVQDEQSDLQGREDASPEGTSPDETSNSHATGQTEQSGVAQPFSETTPDANEKDAQTETGNASAEEQPSKDVSAKVTSGVGFKSDDGQESDVIDTVDVKSASGNWVFKNYWWRKIEELYGKIKEAFNRVMTSRMSFFTKRSEVDKELDRFYQHVGLEQGPLEDIINLGLEVIEKEKKEQGFLNKKERAFFEKVKDRKHQLEQLKEDVKAIEELDQKIDEALEVVLQQVDVCNKYEQEAWTTFKNVARELSDKEARKQYYDTKGLLKDTEKVYQYLTGPFNNYFQQMVQGVQEHTQSIIAKLGALKNEEVDLKKEADLFEQEDEALEKQQVAKKHEKHEKKQKSPTIFERVTGWIASLFAPIKHAWNFLVQKGTALFGSSTVVKKAEAGLHDVEKTVVQEAQYLEKEVSAAKQTVEKQAKDVEENIEKGADKVKQLFGGAFDVDNKEKRKSEDTSAQ